MAAVETGKQRASRIQHDYYKRLNVWERRKRLYTLLFCPIVCALWACSLLFGYQGAMHSPGSVAAVHQTWNNDCDACHRPSDTARGFSSVFAAMTGRQQPAPVRDQSCRTCHTGTEHQTTQISAEVPGCAACHVEHRGVDASLVRIDDNACTQCHGAIDKHIDHTKVDPGKVAGHAVANAGKRQLASVTGFAKDHFHLLAKDPGTITFSHAVHMSPGLLSPGSTNAWTLKDIPDQSQIERYRRGRKDTDLVQLDCNSCHELDSGDFHLANRTTLPGAALPERTAGAYMLPITYENQCQACHQLRYDPDDPAATVAHRQTPEKIRRLIQQAYTAKLVSDASGLLGQFVPPNPLPSDLPPLSKELKTSIHNKVLLAERILNHEACGKCHNIERNDGGSLRSVAPSNLQAVWFKNARFDHHAHRAVSCAECHSGAIQSKNAADVLIPGADVCVKCHAPRSETSTESHGGARFDCVECHRYHNGAAPLAGLGAQSEVPSQKMDLKTFENGPKNQP